jgi:hypothetical protein
MEVTTSITEEVEAGEVGVLLVVEEEAIYHPPVPCPCHLLDGITTLITTIRKLRLLPLQVMLQQPILSMSW